MATYHRHIKMLEQVHTRSLRVNMGIRWQDRVTNQAVLVRAGSTSIESKPLKAQLCWTGRVIRMSDSRIPRQLLYSELVQGSCKRERPKLRNKDTLKSKLKWSSIKLCDLESSAADRSAWRSFTLRAAAAFEEDWHQRLTAARDRRYRAAPASIQTTDCCYNTCVIAALDCGVTCTLIAESADCVIVGHRWTTIVS